MNVESTVLKWGGTRHQVRNSVEPPEKRRLCLAALDQLRTFWSAYTPQSTQHPLQPTAPPRSHTFRGGKFNGRGAGELPLVKGARHPGRRLCRRHDALSIATGGLRSWARTLGLRRGLTMEQQLGPSSEQELGWVGECGTPLRQRTNHLGMFSRKCLKYVDYLFLFLQIRRSGRCAARAQRGPPARHV